MTDRTDSIVSDAPTLAVRNLRIDYGTRRAVDGVSFEVRPGEIFGLLGPNGAGKTSTLSAIEGLVTPTEGSVSVLGIDAQAHASLARAQIGVQLQTTTFPPQLTIAEIVRLFAGLYGLQLSSADVRERLAELHLEEDARQRFDQLSGGQQQRLSLIVATVHDPGLLLLDEPTASLDPQSRRQLWQHIEASRRQGRSILLTTHSMEEAQAVRDRVAIMDHGAIIASDTPADLIATHSSNPAVLAAAHGAVTLEDVFIGLTGSDLRD